MADGRPHLIAVEGTAARAAAAAPRADRRGMALLLVLALLCALGFGLTRRQVGLLRGELAASQQALADASRALAAIEAQRNEVRGQLQTLATEAAGLAGRLAELEALVATDPARAADAQALRNEASPPN